MRTYFGGRVDLELEVAQDGNSIAVYTKIDLAAIPKEIFMRLRASDGRRLVSAFINGTNTPVLEGDIFNIPVHKQGEYQIIAHFE